MGSLEIKTGASPIHSNHTNKEQWPERIKNRSFIHSLKTVKNTVIQSIISIYHKLRFILKQKFENIETVDNPAYHKNTATNSQVPINNRLPDYFENTPPKQFDTAQPQEKNKIQDDLSPLLQTQSVNLDIQKKTIIADKAKSIYLKNIELINQYSDIPKDKKTDFNTMNKAIFALLSNPEYIKQEGFFRINGVQSKIPDLLVELASNADFNQLLINNNSFRQNELTGVIKVLRNDIMTEHPTEKNKHNELVNTYKESIDHENATKKYVADMNLNKRDKILRIASNNAEKRLPSLQELPLHLQICMPLFVDVAKHSKENRMEPMQIATAIGGGLSSAKRTPVEEMEFKKLNKEQQKELLKQETDHMNLANELLMKLIKKQLK